MAIILKVKWVDQADRPELHQRIQRIGGDAGQLQWKHTQASAVESIERGMFDYYIDGAKPSVRLEVNRTPEGLKYLIASSGAAQMLLDLPAFPEVAADAPANATQRGSI